MRHGPSLKAITLLRKTPGMEIEVGGIRRLSTLGQSILTTARYLPQRKADRLIRSIRKHIPSVQALLKVDADRFVKGLAKAGEAFREETSELSLLKKAMAIQEIARDIRQRIGRMTRRNNAPIRPGDEVEPNMIAVKSSTGKENERRIAEDGQTARNNDETH